MSSDAGATHPCVETVHLSAGHTMGKPAVSEIRLVGGIGVEGDAHAGATVQHLSRIARDPTQPNLRQVHLIPAEVHDGLEASGLDVAPGAMGENLTTRGLDLFALPVRTRLRLGALAEVELTGLRNPCRQLEGVREGLQSAVLLHGPDGGLVRRAGVMAIVVAAGPVVPGDPIAVIVPPEPHEPLVPV